MLVLREKAGTLLPVGLWTSMSKGNFDDGYRDGWEGVAGMIPLPSDPTRPIPGEPDDYGAGFLYGRSDALERRPLFWRWVSKV